MLSIIADMLLTATKSKGPHGFPDHLKENADRYTRSHRAQRHHREADFKRHGGDFW